MTKQLLNKNEMAAELGSGFTAWTILDLQRKRKIPAIRLGHRTVLFDPEEVRRALEAFKVKAIR
jgi:hypothetical protein